MCLQRWNFHRWSKWFGGGSVCLSFDRTFSDALQLWEIWQTLKQVTRMRSDRKQESGIMTFSPQKRNLFDLTEYNFNDQNCQIQPQTFKTSILFPCWPTFLRFLTYFLFSFEKVFQYIIEVSFLVEKLFLENNDFIQFFVFGIGDQERWSQVSLAVDGGCPDLERKECEKKKKIRMWKWWIMNSNGHNDASENPHPFCLRNTFHASKV